MVCLDRISIWSCIKILFSSEKSVIVLEDYKKNSIIIFIFGLFGIGFNQAKFFAGHLKSYNGDSVPFAALKIANLECTRISRNHIKRIDNIDFLYEFLNKDALILHYSKKILPEINRFMLNIKVAESLGLEKKIMIRSSILVSSDDIYKIIKNNNIEIYRDYSYIIYQFIETLAIMFFKGYFRIMIKKTKLLDPCFSNKSNSSILTLKTNTLRLDKSYRGQPYWRSDNGKLKNIPIYILSDRSIEKYEEQNLMEQNIFQVNAVLLGSVRGKLKSNEHIKKLRLARTKIYRKVRLSNVYTILRLLITLRGVEIITELILHLNVKIFVNEEPYIDNADYIEMIAKSLGVKTLGYQYSNLGNCSTPMISTSDYFFVFSKNYKEIFVNDGIGPKEIISNGYPYDINNKEILKRSKILREKLGINGAKFIICYFDERVDHDKWGVTNNISHYKELRELIEFVCHSKDIGLIIKSQFSRYSPSNWYPSDPLIMDAIDTGRYVELVLGEIGKRNDIFPSEAAHASDFCISQKFGATAALESALCGKKVALLNSKSYHTAFDDFYEKADIVRESMSDVIASIKSMRNLNHGYENYKFGNWSSVLRDFNDENNSEAYLRIEDKIYDLLN
jgi:hypothetical protein